MQLEQDAVSGAAGGGAVDDTPVTFTINGASYTCADRSRLLIDFLHASPADQVAPGAGLHGTKLACGQGGCGACTVNVRDPSGYITAVNSCLKPLGLLDNKNIETIEALGPPPQPPVRGVKAAAQLQIGHACTHTHAEGGKGACGGQCGSCAHALSGVQGGASNASTADVRLTLAQYNGSQCGFCSPGMIMTARPLVGQGKSEMDIEDIFSGNLCRSDRIIT